jgi:hypothetical protein
VQYIEHRINHSQAGGIDRGRGSRGMSGANQRDWCPISDILRLGLGRLLLAENRLQQFYPILAVTQGDTHQPGADLLQNSKRSRRPGNDAHIEWLF